MTPSKNPPSPTTPPVDAVSGGKRARDAHHESLRERIGIALRQIRATLPSVQQATIDTYLSLMVPAFAPSRGGDGIAKLPVMPGRNGFITTDRFLLLCQMMSNMAVMYWYFVEMLDAEKISDEALQFELAVIEKVAAKGFYNHTAIAEPAGPWFRLVHKDEALKAKREKLRRDDLVVTCRAMDLPFTDAETADMLEKKITAAAPKA